MRQRSTHATPRPTVSRWIPPPVLLGEARPEAAHLARQVQPLLNRVDPITSAAPSAVRRGAHRPIGHGAKTAHSLADRDVDVSAAEMRWRHSASSSTARRSCRPGIGARLALRVWDGKYSALYPQSNCRAASRRSSTTRPRCRSTGPPRGAGRRSVTRRGDRADEHALAKRVALDSRASSWRRRRLVDDDAPWRDGTPAQDVARRCRRSSSASPSWRREAARGDLAVGKRCVGPSTTAGAS